MRCMRATKCLRTASSRAGAASSRPGRQCDRPELEPGQLAAELDRRPDRGARSDPDGTGAQARQGRRQAAAAPAAAAPSQDDIVRAAADSIRAMLLIRTYRVRGHLAANLDPLGLVQARDAGRSDDGISRLLQRRYRPAGLSRRHARPAMGDGARDRRHPARELLRQCRPRIYAHRRCRGAPLPAGPHGRQGQGDRVQPARQEGDPQQGDRGRAVGEILRPQICRDEALRPRRRRER